MTTGALCHYLLVYDHAQSALVSQQEYRSVDEATAAYADAETAARDDENLEIVLVGADSFDTIRVTHASYFEGTATKSQFLVGT